MRDELRHIIHRLTAYGCNPVELGNGVWRAHCPTHRATTGAVVDLDVDESGVWVDVPGCGCLPGEIANIIGVQVERAGWHSYVKPAERAQVLAAVEGQRAERARAVADGRAGQLGVTPGEIYHALTKRLAVEFPHNRRGNRYRCPSCGDERHGGVKVDLVGGAVLLTCFGQRCDAAAILEPLGLAPRDLYPPRPALPDVTFDDAPEPIARPATVDAEPGSLVGPAGEAAELDLGLSEDPMTDGHLAERFAGRLRDHAVWVAGLGWHEWTARPDGRWWAAVPEESILERCRRWVLAEYARCLRQAGEAVAACDMLRSEQLTLAANAWRKVASHSRLTALVKLARGIQRADPADFDSHPHLLNVRNGVVDLRTGKIRPHDPGLALTKHAPVDYVPGATHPAWTQALTAVEPEVAEWMRWRLGQAATGYPPNDDVVVVARGSGSNGKSTLYGGVQRALGDYSVLISDRVLMANPGDHPTELMGLRGARFALIEETPEERRLDTQRLKKITGTARVTARLIGQDNVTFDVTHSLHVTSNFRPAVTTTDHGTWRRLALVDFAKTFPPSDLRDRIKDDHAVHRAVLAWLVSGAVDWFKAGRRLPLPPGRVAADTDAWRADADLILMFWTTALVPDHAAYVVSDELYECFVASLRAGGHQAWSRQTFVDRFRDHDQTRRYSVHQSRPKRPPTIGLYRWGVELFPPAPPSGRPHIWTGVRYLGEDDQGSDQRGPEGPDV